MIESKYVYFEMPDAVNVLISKEIDEAIESFVAESHLVIWPPIVTNTKSCKTSIAVRIGDSGLGKEVDLNELVLRAIDRHGFDDERCGLLAMAAELKSLAEEIEAASKLK